MSVDSASTCPSPELRWEREFHTTLTQTTLHGTSTRQLPVEFTERRPLTGRSYGAKVGYRLSAVLEVEES